MKKTNAFLFLLTLVIFSGMMLSSCKSKTGSNQQSEKPAESASETSGQDEGWIVMFNGSSTDGWRGYNKQTFPTEGWVIDGAALKCVGSGNGETGGKGGDIIYDKKFKDFDLTLEWKISEGGNSGIFYLAKEIPGEPIWKSAPEYQILDNERHIDAKLGKNGNRQAGSLYDLIPASPQNAKPAGEWNSAEIMVYQGTVIHKMNGEVVVEYHIGTPDFEEMIANSKFKDFHEFGKYREGYIGLQDHGSDVWFRNIQIKDLSID